MGTITDKLNLLANTKESIKQSIIAKGVMINDSDTFASYASKIDAIPQEGAGIAAGTKLAYSTFTQIPEQYINYLYSCEDLGYMLAYCNSLTSVPDLNLSNALNAGWMFAQCENLKEVGQLNLSKATSINNMFYKSGVVKVGRLYIGSVDNYRTEFLHTAQRNVTLSDFGKGETLDTAWFTEAPNWGIEDPNEPLSIGARQSVIDSLLTYSYDRAAAGYHYVDIHLAPATYALLSEEEISQIQAKRYTLHNG